MACNHGLAIGVDSQRSAAETESGRGLFRPRQTLRLVSEQHARPKMDPSVC